MVMDIKALVADHMGHFSVYDIPGLLFALIAAACLGFVIARWGARHTVESARRVALWCMVAALAAALVRSQLPVAALMLAAAVIIGKRSGPSNDDPVLLGALVAGVGCGSGASLIVAVAMIPFIPLMRWALRGTIGG